jgi:transcriptional regulator PpsR
MPVPACGNETRAEAGKRGVHWGISALVKTFVSPQTSLGDLDAGSAASLIAASSDVTLIIDAHGTIRDTAFQSAELLDELNESAQWVGRPMAETVAPDSRPKVEALLREAATAAEPKWRHINHLTPAGRSVPVSYCGVRIGAEGRIVAFGRDLRVMSALQQRLMNAQQSMERDYSKLRDVEMRYRLLFQLSSEAVLILDPVKGRVLEANAAAQGLFGAGSDDIVGRAMADIFDPDSLAALQGHLAAIRAGARPEDTPARLVRGGQPVLVKVSLFRQESAALFLMRISPVVTAVPALPDVKTKLLRAVESAPDGFVLTDHQGAIITANAAFLDMAQLLDENQARGEALDRWVGASGVDLDVLTANLRDRGSVRFFTTTMRGEAGAVAQVEISAVSIRNGGHPSFGYAIRNVGPRLQTDTRAARQLPRSVEQLTELIGRVSLKDLVREATEVIERLAIEAALELTHDNRASAAEMLGLSRQSLYVKLRRYGLGDLTAVEPS